MIIQSYKSKNYDYYKKRGDFVSLFREKTRGLCPDEAWSCRQKSSKTTALSNRSVLQQRGLYVYDILSSVLSML
jgi:hypothetical protein